MIPSTDPNLLNQARAFWRENLPGWYQQLLADQNLEQTLYDAVERTLDEVAELVENGMTMAEAKEIVLPKYLFREIPDLS
jgi:hypothetical protein